MDQELKDLLAELFKHYKESHCVQGEDGLAGADKVSCYGCGAKIEYDDQMKEWPPMVHTEDCPTTIMGKKIKDFLKKRMQNG
jgi:hypothetical protein